MPELKAFRVKGEFMMGRRWQPFSKEFAAEDKETCAELAYSILGSNHNVKRKFIKIEGIEQIMKTEDIEDLAVRGKLEAKK
ncbi:MAG: 50S ribosomal protein L18a [Thermoplasmata archaeon]|nr:50S ribosomal protein L18a [Thermoplasmata archaeon]